MCRWDRRGPAAQALCPAEGLPLSQRTRMTGRYDDGDESVDYTCSRRVCAFIEAMRRVAASTSVVQ